MTTDNPMQLGMIGLGRMGANLVRRLMRDGHRCVVYDVNSDAVDELAGEGATGAHSLEEFVGALEVPRAVWIMVPAGYVQGTVDQLAGLLDADDVIIDGGNSYYRDDLDRSKALRSSGIHYLDCGTSGGVWGLERGYCLMIGGDTDAVAASWSRSSPRSPRERATWTRPRDANPAVPPSTATSIVVPAEPDTS